MEYGNIWLVYRLSSFAHRWTTDGLESHALGFAQLENCPTSEWLTEASFRLQFIDGQIGVNVCWTSLAL